VPGFLSDSFCEFLAIDKIISNAKGCRKVLKLLNAIHYFDIYLGLLLDLTRIRPMQNISKLEFRNISVNCIISMNDYTIVLLQEKHIIMIKSDRFKSRRAACPYCYPLRFS
jgi:hypothetical protein